jgi:hypothetical protein
MDYRAVKLVRWWDLPSNVGVDRHAAALRREAYIHQHAWRAMLLRVRVERPVRHRGLTASDRARDWHARTPER